MISTKDQVIARRSGSVGTIVLDHPARLNALTPGMVAGIQQLLEDFHGDGRVRAVVIAGSGDSFCSGTDLNTIRFAPPGDLPPLLQEDVVAMEELLEYMLRFPRPLVAAVSGWTAGTGLALMLACDLAIAAENSRFWVAEPRLGLSPALTAPLLAWRLGASRAAAMLIGAVPVNAADALAMGLVHEIQPPDLVWARASQWVGQIAEGAHESHQLTRSMLYETIGEALFTQLAIGAAQTATARTTAVASERVRKFLDKDAAGGAAELPSGP